MHVSLSWSRSSNSGVWAFGTSLAICCHNLMHPIIQGPATKYVLTARIITFCKEKKMHFKILTVMKTVTSSPFPTQSEIGRFFTLGYEITRICFWKIHKISPVDTIFLCFLLTIIIRVILNDREYIIYISSKTSKFDQKIKC